MDEEERIRRRNMLAEISRFYRELRIYTLRYGKNPLDSTQSIFYKKLCNLRILRNVKGYREALSKINTVGLRRYRDMVRGLLSLLIGNKINNISPLDTIMWEDEEEKDVIYDERILAINILERDAEADFNILSTRWTYANKMLPDNIRLRGTGPCYMRALMAVAETFIGRNLCLVELDRLIPILTAGSNPAVDATGAKGSGIYYVWEPLKVIEETLNFLESGSKFRINITSTKRENEVAAGSLREISSTGHWQEGDSCGNFRWDGYYGLGNGNVNIRRTRYVYIERLPV
jgi:hypothetical protein